MLNKTDFWRHVERNNLHKELDKKTPCNTCRDTLRGSRVRDYG